MENRHLVAIPEAVLKEILMKINDAKELLLPYVNPLTPDERHNMLKMGEKSLSFVEKSHEFAQQNPTLVPPYLNMNEFSIDFADAHGLWSVQNAARQLCEGIDDTSMVAGSEAMQAALVFYNSVKVAAAGDVSGAKAIYEELKKRFPGNKHRKPVTEE
jgi:hypothetical protein